MGRGKVNRSPKSLTLRIAQSRWLVFVFLLMWVFPFVYPSLYWLTIMSYLVAAGLFALSYDIVLGQTGILSFGHAASFGIGAYALYWTVHAGYPFLLGVFAAMALGVLVNLAMGTALLRVKGVYFAMFTLAFAEAIYLFLSNQTSITGGTTGVVSPRPVFLQNSDMILAFSSILVIASLIAGYILVFHYLKRGEVTKPGIGLALLTIATGYSLLSLNSRLLTIVKVPIAAFTMNAYFVSVLILFVSYYFISRLMHSRLGSVFIALRENDERTAMIGYNTLGYKLASMGIGGMFAGLAGCMIAAFATFIITPDLMSSNYTVNVLLYSILGGIGTLVGPVIGAFIIEFLHFNIGYLSAVVGLPSLAVWWMLIIGVFYILVVLFIPYGIVGTVTSRRRHVVRYLKKLLGVT